MRLVSLADTKTMIPVSGATFDTLLTLLIEGYSSTIEKHLNRELVKQARTRKFRGGSRSLWLPAFPIDLSATLTIKEDSVTLVKDSDYYVDDLNGVIEFNDEITKRIALPLEVTWTGGYVEAAGGGETTVQVPSDIKLATYLQVNYVYRRRDKLGLNQVNLGNELGSVGIEGVMTLLPEVKKMLETYRRLPGQP